jgi:ABC-2 type transport system ATP-binding protein
VDPPAVELHDVQKRYGDIAAVAGLSLTAAAGEVMALLGPNGAGKTTTVEMCEGYRRADGGTVRVLGLDPVADARRLRPRVGVMLQGGGAYPGATAGEMLRLLAAYAAEPLDPGQLLERLGLTAAAGTAYKRLSGGQKQRLSLAMAVVARPELVFLDEPTAGMDPQARHATWDVVRQLRADGVTVVLTTHYMEEAERLADQVVVVDGGRAVAVGTPAELTRGTDGQLRFTAAAGLDLVALTAALPSKVTVSEPRRGEYLVTVAGAVDPQLVAAVTAWCAEHDVLAEELKVRRRSLEDVFLELTGRGLR